MLNKDQIIGQIQQINRTASRGWLDGFERPELLRYLEHLQRTLEPRGSTSFWVRYGETPPIVTRRPLRR